MNIKIKTGVVFKEFNDPFIRVLNALDGLGTLFGKPRTITSANDGKHMKTSLHYENLAWDTRTRDLPEDKKQRFLFELKTRLGSGFIVLLERPGEPEEHIHIQFGTNRK